MSSNPNFDEKSQISSTYTSKPGVSPQAQMGVPLPLPGQVAGTGYPPTANSYPQPAMGQASPEGVYPASLPPPGHYQTNQTVTHQTHYVSNIPNPGGIQNWIPVMPMWAAVTLCVVNCILPGFGTMIAGFAVFCCAQSQPQGATGPCAMCCINFWLGVAQLFFAFYFFGWVWSIIWGVLFIQLSSQYYGKTNVNTVVTTQTVTVS